MYAGEVMARNEDAWSTTRGRQLCKRYSLDRSCLALNYTLASNECVLCTGWFFVRKTPPLTW